MSISIDQKELCIRIFYDPTAEGANEWIEKILDGLSDVMDAICESHDECVCPLWGMTSAGVDVEEDDDEVSTAQEPQQ